MPLRLREDPGSSTSRDELRRIQDELNRLHRRGGHRPWRTRFAGASEYPPVNVWEGEHDILVIAEVPGVAAEDIEITVHDGALSIRGAVAPEAEGGEAVFHRRERHYGAFARTVNLPFEAESEQVQAQCTDGILRIYLPRPETRKPTRIKVSGG